jgi:hypothetical protein
MLFSQTVKKIEEQHPPLLARIRIARPYKIPKGYLSWRSLSTFLCAAPGMVSLAKPDDLPGITIPHRLSLWLVQDAPIYCLTQELIDAFAQTDVLDLNNLFQDFETPIPTLLLLPPMDIGFTTPAGNLVKFIICHLSDHRFPERSYGFSKEFGFRVNFLDHLNDRLIHCGAVDEAGIFWFAGMGIEFDGSINFEGGQSEGSASFEDGDDRFLNTLRSLVLQCFLALQYQPELLSDVELPTQKKGFSKPNEQEPSYGTCK